MVPTESVEQLYASYCKTYVLVRSGHALEPSEYGNYTEGRWTSAAIASDDARNGRSPRTRLDLVAQIAALLAVAPPK